MARRLQRALASAAALPALSALFAAGCIFSETPGPDRHAGGTIETTNGIIVMSGGRPAARIKVYLLDERSWLSNVKDGKPITVDSVETNDTGYFSIRRDTASKVSLMANTEGQGIIIRQLTAARIRDGFGNKLALQPHITYRGHIGPEVIGARQVYLAGTPFSAPIDEQGAFTIAGVPPEKYQVVIKRVGPDLSESFFPAGELDLINQDTVNDPDTLKPDLSRSVLFEDFEDNNSRTLLAPLEGDGYWAVYSDAHLRSAASQGSSATLISPVNGASQYFMPAIKNGGAPGRERSLEVTYQMGEGGNDWKPYSFVHVFANFGQAQNEKYALYNFSRMDTVSFWAKGSGSLVMAFWQQQIGIPLKVLAGGTVALTEGWQHFKLAVKDFEVTVVEFPAVPAQFHAQLQASGMPAYTAAPATWEQTGGIFRTLEILGTGGTSFWIDDIRFHGMVLDDLLK